MCVCESVCTSVWVNTVYVSIRNSMCFSRQYYAMRNADTSHMLMYKRTNCVWTLVGLLFAQPNVVFIFDLCRLSCANSIQPINLCVLATHVIGSNMGCL